MLACKTSSSIPQSINHLSKADGPQTEEEQAEMKKVPYAEFVGALLHLAVKTRQDIYYAVNVLSRFNANPGRKHWEALKGVLRYLKGTQTKGLIFPGAGSLTVTANVDANFAQDPDNRRSTVGMNMFMGKSLIAAKSVATKTVMASSCEAEIRGLYEGTTCATWMTKQLKFFGITEKPVVIFCDNQGTIKWALNKQRSGKMKHIDVKSFFIREKIDDHTIELQYVPTEENSADILTKVPPSEIPNNFSINKHSIL